MSRQQSRIKKTKNTSSRNKIVFCSKYNPLGPNIKSISQKHVHILDDCQIMQNKEITVAYKREKYLNELLTRADPYNIINNVDDEMHTYVLCKQRCDSYANFVVAKKSFECFATKRVYKSQTVYLMRFQKRNLYCTLFEYFKTGSRIYC